MAGRASIGPSPVCDILLVERFNGDPVGQRYEARSMPGHLLHWVISGHVEQQCSGGHQLLKPGCVVWYYENELVRGVVRHGPWTFYSINFYAPELEPPAARVIPDQVALGSLFEQAYQAWVGTADSAARRQFLVHAKLLQILAELAQKTLPRVPVHAGRRLWWAVEEQYRRRPRHGATLDALAQAHGVSTATLLRACHAAVGMPPKRRLREICLHHGRSLLHHTTQSVTEIAALLGYVRIHEFSRDYRNWFGQTPSSERNSRSARKRERTSAR